MHVTCTEINVDVQLLFFPLIKFKEQRVVSHRHAVCENFNPRLSRAFLLQIVYCSFQIQGASGTNIRQDKTILLNTCFPFSLSGSAPVGVLVSLFCMSACPCSLLLTWRRSASPKPCPWLVELKYYRKSCIALYFHTFFFFFCRFSFLSFLFWCTCSA